MGRPGRRRWRSACSSSPSHSGRRVFSGDRIIDVRTRVFLLVSIAVAVVGFSAARMVNNDYVFFAGYTILQFIVLATAWNILGGYTGYVNFGSAAFFAMGAYSTVFFHKAFPMPIPILILIGGVVSGVVGFGMGYLTLRLRGAFFAIARLARGLHHPAQRHRMARTLYPIPVPADADARGRLAHHRALDRALAARLRLRHHPRRRARGRSLGRADAEAQARRHHHLRRAHGHGRSALSVLHRLPATVVGVRAGICRELHCHADDRWHHELGRAPDRRDPVGVFAADRDRHHILGGQPAHRRAAAGRLRHHRAERHRRAGAGLDAQEREIMAGALLEVAGLSKRFGGFVALDGIDLAVTQGERVGLIGPNGSGKSTFVNCICGTLTNETGTVRFDGEIVNGLLTHERTRRGMARSFQLPRPFATLTVADNLTKLPRDLTQVEMRKLELARAMAADPKLLIADESMAGLSQSEVDDIVNLLIRLNERGITIILIEHIMRAVMKFSQRLVVLVSGKKMADGIRDPEVERAYLGQ